MVKRKSKSKPKNKAEQNAAPPSVVPDHIQKARTYQIKRVTKRKLPSFEEAMYLLHVPEMSRLYFKAIFEGLEARDKTALEHAGEMLTYVQRKGFNINMGNQMLQQNVIAGPTAPVIGFDAFTRQLAEARAGHALPIPEDVIDAEVEDVRPADSEVA